MVRIIIVNNDTTEIIVFKSDFSKKKILKKLEKIKGVSLEVLKKPKRSFLDLKGIWKNKPFNENNQ